MSEGKATRHVLVCGGVHPDGIVLLEQAQGVSFETIEDDSAQLAERLPDADGVVMRICAMGADLLPGAKRLKVVSRHGVGCDNVPVAELTERGIPVMITSGANSVAVAEHTVFMLLELCRKGAVMDRAVRQGDWQARKRLTTTQISDKRALVVGCGRIGKAVVNMLSALGMDVVVFDPYVTADVCAALDAECADDLHEELARADVVTLHLPSTGETVIGAKELALMQEHALLVNVARGDLVDEQALAEALKEGRIAGAALDVFSVEPPPVDHPLLGLDNTVLTPHSAALTEDSLRAMGTVSVQNVLDVFDGKPKAENVFNPGYVKNKAGR